MATDVPPWQPTNSVAAETGGTSNPPGSMAPMLGAIAWSALPHLSFGTVKVVIADGV